MPNIPEKLAPQKLTQQDMLEALTIAMSEAVEIEVTTCLTTEDLEQNLTKSKCFVSSGDKQSPSYFRTQINLVNRTVEHEIDLKSIDNYGYRELQRWHIEQVHRRQESVIRNLASLEQMRGMFLNHHSSHR